MSLPKTFYQRHTARSLRTSPCPGRCYQHTQYTRQQYHNRQTAFDRSKNSTTRVLILPNRHEVNLPISHRETSQTQLIISAPLVQVPSNIAYQTSSLPVRNLKTEHDHLRSIGASTLNPSISNYHHTIEKP